MYFYIQNKLINTRYNAFLILNTESSRIHLLYDKIKKRVKFKIQVYHIIKNITIINKLIFLI